jgi:hypothetical protein
MFLVSRLIMDPKWLDPRCERWFQQYAFHQLQHSFIRYYLVSLAWETTRIPEWNAIKECSIWSWIHNCLGHRCERSLPVCGFKIVACNKREIVRVTSRASGIHQVRKQEQGRSFGASDIRPMHDIVGHDCRSTNMPIWRVQVKYFYHSPN